MKTFARIFLVCLALLAPQSVLAGPVRAVVSIVPLKILVERVGGDRVEVSAMVEPGASPATYEPKPSQMAGLAKAQVYFAVGVPFEKAWLPRFRSANKDMLVAPLQEGIERMPMAEHVHEEEGHGHEGHGHEEHGHGGIPDPHIWLSPPLARIMAENIRDGLIAADPGGEAAYRAGYAALAKEINKTDSALLDMFAALPARQTAFVVFHPAFGYFARAYGLEQIPMEVGGKEPGPRELAQLASLARHKGVRVVFTAPQFSTASAKAMAKAIGGNVATANPLAPDWFANMLELGRAFKKAMEEE